MNSKKIVHKVASYEEIMREVRADKDVDRHIFLGNGFNIALGVNTSYDSLAASLLRRTTVSDLLDEHAPGIKKCIEKSPGYMESHIDRIKSPSCKSMVKDILYEKILRRCRTRYKYEEVMDFLSCFNEYYTTNYDPLLYLFLISQKEEKPIDKNGPFYKDLEQINNLGHVTEIIYNAFDEDGKELRGLPLNAMTKKQVYEIAYRLFTDNMKHPREKRNDYFRALRMIRNERMLEVSDGFVSRKNQWDEEYYAWCRKFAEKRIGKSNRKRQNMFYLHGALHIYKDRKRSIKNKRGGAEIKKMHGIDFIQHLLDNDRTPVCVFDGRKSGKVKKIDGNSYLQYCLERLRQIRGELFIVGWSCSENDCHLVEAIRNNPKITQIVISCYPKDGDIMHTRVSYEKKFPNKNTICFDIKGADFYKQSAKDKEKKKEQQRPEQQDLFPEQT